MRRSLLRRGSVRQVKTSVCSAGCWMFWRISERMPTLRTGSTHSVQAFRSIRIGSPRNSSPDIVRFGVNGAGGIVRSDLDDRHLVLGGERDDKSPPIEMDGAQVPPRRRAAQGVVRGSASFDSETHESSRQLGSENDRHLHSVFERAADAAELEPRRPGGLRPRRCIWQPSSVLVVLQLVTHLFTQVLAAHPRRKRALVGPGGRNGRATSGSGRLL